MISREHARETASCEVEAPASLTEEEKTRLVSIQRSHDDWPLCEELGLDQQRLEFARWLIQRGILNEGVE